MTQTLDRMRRANPVPTNPRPPALEPLLGHLDLSVRALDAPFNTPDRAPARPLVRRGLAGVAVATGATIAVIAIAGSPGGGGLSVAAAVDRAVTLGPGVLHIVTSTETLVEGRATSSVQQELWTARNPRRMRTITTVHSGGETVEGEGAILSTTPPRTLSWSRSQPTVIRESTQPILQQENTPSEWLRTAYRQGRLKLLGRSELNGRSVWQLSVLRQGAQSPQEVDGQAVPTSTVLVDAHTFTPLENIIYSATSENGKAVLQTTKVRYSTYEELPARKGSESLLALAAHAGAKVLTEAAPTEH